MAAETMIVVWSIAYAKEFKRLAAQFCTLSMAREWATAGVPADLAAGFASRGYLPGEAASHIAAGRTPAQASDYDAAALDAVELPDEDVFTAYDRTRMMPVMPAAFYRRVNA